MFFSGGLSWPPAEELCPMRCSRSATGLEKPPVIGFIRHGWLGENNLFDMDGPKTLAISLNDTAGLDGLVDHADEFFAVFNKIFFIVDG
jgi:hypothetical protein